MSLKNRSLILIERPVDKVEARHFQLVEDVAPEVGPGEALVRVAWLGIDPTQRTWLNSETTYIDPVSIGEVMRGSGIGEVICSRTQALAVGDWVYGSTGWQELVLTKGEGLFGLNRVPDGVEPRYMLHVLGVSGLTAYFGMIEVGKPAPESLVLVTAAAGSVGSLAGQIAKKLGARVIGTAGTDEKCRWAVERLGFTACINYREEDVSGRIKQYAPNGLDVVFDNVGGTVLEAALDNLAINARVVLCGSISSGYRHLAYGVGPQNYMQLAFRRARMEGFVFLDYADRFPVAFSQICQWIADGSLIVNEDIVDGLENAPAALQGLFEGHNIGKRLVRLTS